MTKSWHLLLVYQWPMGKLEKQKGKGKAKAKGFEKSGSFGIWTRYIPARKPKIPWVIWNGVHRPGLDRGESESERQVESESMIILDNRTFYIEGVDVPMHCVFHVPLRYLRFSLTLFDHTETIIS